MIKTIITVAIGVGFALGGYYLSQTIPCTLLYNFGLAMGLAIMFVYMAMD
jgi:hypothetical protein